MSSRDRVRRLIRRGRPRGVSPEARAELDAALEEISDVAEHWEDYGDDQDGLTVAEWLDSVAAMIEENNRCRARVSP
jgi:hypothetical protein